MSFNPLRYRAQMLAQAKRPSPEVAQRTVGDDSLHLQLLGLERDVKRLRDLPRIADRIEMKRSELLPRWRPYVERYLAAGEVYPYLVFSYCVIWLFDTGDIDAALDWADNRVSISQDCVHSIIESGLVKELIAERSPVLRADILLRMELLVETDERIVPGTVLISDGGNGDYFIDAETYDFGPISSREMLTA